MFTSCTTASLTYQLEDAGQSGEIELVRLTPDVFCGLLSP
jgi:hypothetical protein